jgi:ABC-type multidrug transport system permease subunit
MCASRDRFEHHILFNWIQLHLVFLPIVCCVLHFNTRYVNDDFFIYLCTVLAESIGLAVGAIIPTVDLGNLIITVMLTVWMSVGGYLVRNARVSWYFYPLAYTSPFRYAFQGLVINEFSEKSFTCPNLCDLPDIFVQVNGTAINLRDMQVCVRFVCF